MAEDAQTQVGEIDLKELLEAGVHFGHQTNRWNPRMRDYIYSQRDGVHIFDLVKTAQQLEEAKSFVTKLGKKNKNIIFVGTKRQAQDIIREKAEEAGAMYIVTRWLGGFLTNWEQVSKSIRKMNRTYKGLDDGRYDHYTKFEQVQMRKEADRKARFLEGVKDLKTLPDAIFIADLVEEKVAAKEARLMGIPVIAIADSNADPRLADIIIPGNDDAVSSLTVLVGHITQAYAQGKKAKK